MDEDSTIVYTAHFADGMEMDIKCCGVEYIEGKSNQAWTEAILFKNGRELCFTEPSDEYFGEWTIEYENNEYVAIVEEE